MRLFAMAAAAVVIAASAAATASSGAREMLPAAAPALDQPTDWSAAKTRRQRAQGAYARSPSQGHIACTQFGCHPVRRGCYPVEQRYWDGDPTGFDAVVCPRR